MMMEVLNQEVIGKTFHFNTNNMNRILSFSLTLIFAMVLGSCSSKQDPVNELEELAYELKENSADYSQEDWEDVAVRYAEIEEDLQRNEYTDEELKRIGKLKAQCFRAIIRSSANSFKSLMHNMHMQMEGASEELNGTLEEVNEIFEDTFNEKIE